MAREPDGDEGSAESCGTTPTRPDNQSIRNESAVTLARNVGDGASTLQPQAFTYNRLADGLVAQHRQVGEANCLYAVGLHQPLVATGVVVGLAADGKLSCGL